MVPAEVRVLADVNDTGNKTLAGQNPEIRREWDERVRRHTAESVALARARGVPVLLLTAAREHDDGHGMDDLVQPMLGDGVYFPSMKEILQKTNFISLYSDGTHLRPPGHALIADAVVKELLQEKIAAAGK